MGIAFQWRSSDEAKQPGSHILKQEEQLLSPVDRNATKRPAGCMCTVGSETRLFFMYESQCSQRWRYCGTNCDSRKLWETVRQKQNIPGLVPVFRRLNRLGSDGEAIGQGRAGDPSPMALGDLIVAGSLASVCWSLAGPRVVWCPFLAHSDRPSLPPGCGTGWEVSHIILAPESCSGTRPSKTVCLTQRRGKQKRCWSR